MGTDLRMFLLTADNLVRCHWDGRSRQVEVLDRVLEGEVLREVARDAGDPNRLYAATSTELHVSEDGGESWKWIPSGGLDYRDIWTMQAHPTRPGELYVGTLPAAVYVSEDGGRSFRELSAFRKLEDYARWTFPPPPHTAHIRCIVLDGRVPDEIVVGVEEGGVVRSRDQGETWEDISGPTSAAAYPEFNDPSGKLPYQMGAHEDGRVYRDVHWLRRDPASLDTLYATTGIGTYRTDDGGCPGASWNTTWDVPTPFPSTSIPPCRSASFWARPRTAPPPGKAIARSARGRTTPFASAATLRRSWAAQSPPSCAATTVGQRGGGWKAACHRDTFT